MIFDVYKVGDQRDQGEKVPPNFNYNKVSDQVQEGSHFNLLPGTKHISIRVQPKE